MRAGNVGRHMLHAAVITSNCDVNHCLSGITAATINVTKKQILTTRLTVDRSVTREPVDIATGGVDLNLGKRVYFSTYYSLSATKGNVLSRFLGDPTIIGTAAAPNPNNFTLIGTIGPVHVRIATGAAHPVVQWIRGFYLLIIPLTLGFMVLHNLLDWLKKLRSYRRPEFRGEHVVRMNLWFRIAHWGVMLSFPTLVFTGFALKYPDSWWSAPFLLWGRHEAFRGTLHRTAAVVLIVATLYHLIHLALNRRDRAFLLAMLPKVKDATDLVDVLRYNLGTSKKEPQFGKFNYAEKMEYWAFLWGTAVMAISGFLLWFNNLALRHFPKWITDAATAVHWYEALLATFSILLWHFYMVIFDPLVYPMDTAWLYGKISAGHYRDSRPAYLKALERAGLVESARDQETLAIEAPPGQAPPDSQKS